MKSIAHSVSKQVGFHIGANLTTAEPTEPVNADGDNTTFEKTDSDGDNIVFGDGFETD